MSDANDILVVSTAYTTDESRYKIFRDSCARHDVPVKSLGIGETYPDMHVLEAVANFLELRDERHIVLTDAYDALVNRWYERELSRLIDSAPHCMMSVEPQVWPVGQWHKAYAQLDGRYRWKAICGGQWCGRREQMIEVLKAIYAGWKAGGATAGGTSQEILHKMYAGLLLGGRWPFTLDLSCTIFQSMIGPEAKLIDDHVGCAYNTVTHSTPMFLHFNGQGQDLSEYWRWSSLLGYERQ